MKVWVITLELDYEGEMVEEVWKKEEQARHRINYLNKNKAGCTERYIVRGFDLKNKDDKVGKDDGN